MAGYVAVTDEMTLTALGAVVVAKEFPRRSEIIAPPPTPAYAGAAKRAKSWLSPFYNQESPITSTLRGRIVDALYAGADFHLVHIGDSKTNGTGVGAGEAYLYAYPAILRRMLGAVEGAINADPTGSLWDKRWTTPTGLRGPYNFDQLGVVPHSTGSGPYQVKFVSDFAHTGGTFWVHAAAGATLTVIVDGGSPQTINIASGNGFKAATPTVVGDSAHTYQIDSPSPFHVTTFVPTYNGPRLKVTRLGRGGSTAKFWQPGYKADGTGLWDSLNTTGFDAITVEVGTNGTQGATNAADVTALYGAIAALKIPTLAITPGGLGGTGAPNTIESYTPMYTATWDAADLHNLPLIDFQSVIGDYPTATAAGLMADTLHESRRGYAYEAAALKRMIA